MCIRDRHCQPASMVLQSPEQPSPLAVLVSSQASWLVSFPSPHMANEIQGPVRWQFHSFGFSNWHVFVQPSPPTVFPSSHCSSGLSANPLPHVLSNCCSLSGVTVAWKFTVPPVLPPPPGFGEPPAPLPTPLGEPEELVLGEQPLESCMKRIPMRGHTDTDLAMA